MVVGFTVVVAALVAVDVDAPATVVGDADPPACPQAATNRRQRIRAADGDGREARAGGTGPF